MPCGEGDGHWPMMPRKLRKDINFIPEIDFWKGFIRWKGLSEYTVMVSSFDELWELKKSGKIYTPIP